MQVDGCETDGGGSTPAGPRAMVEKGARYAQSLPGASGRAAPGRGQADAVPHDLLYRKRRRGRPSPNHR